MYRRTERSIIAQLPAEYGLFPTPVSGESASPLGLMGIVSLSESVFYAYAGAW
jgi:hypothetical protein